MSLLTRKATMIPKKRPSGRGYMAGRPLYTAGTTLWPAGHINRGFSSDVTQQPLPVTDRSSSYVTLLQTPSDSESWQDTILLSDDDSLGLYSYDSVCAQLKEANTDSDSSWEFICKASSIIARTSVKYLDECPSEPKIPVYLLVGGTFSLLKLIMLLCKQIRSRHYHNWEEFGGVYDDDDDDVTCDPVMTRMAMFTEHTLSVFLFVWFICGNYWVFLTRKPNYKQPLYDPKNWCNRVVYLFAFHQIIVCYILIALIVVLMALMFICHKCAHK